MILRTAVIAHHARRVFIPIVVYLNLVRAFVSVAKKGFEEIGR
jgi:hypothetical protein